MVSTEIEVPHLILPDVLVRPILGRSQWIHRWESRSGRWQRKTFQMKAKFLLICSQAKKSSFLGQREGKLLQCCGLFIYEFQTKLSFFIYLITVLGQHHRHWRLRCPCPNVPSSVPKRWTCSFEIGYIMVFTVSSFHLIFTPEWMGKIILVF